MNMKDINMRHMWIFYIAISGLFSLLSSCNGDEPEPEVGLTGNKTVFNLEEVGDSGISGSITFEERDDNSTQITVELSGTSNGSSHPNHIHKNSIAESGDTFIPLTNIDGATGRAETIVVTLVDGTRISYTELINFDGHVNVHLSESDFSNIIAAGEIGDNVLTGESELYPLMGEGIEGNIKFEKRKSGATLVTVNAPEAESSSDHPAHIHSSSMAEGGEIVISLNSLDGTSGVSQTNIEFLDDGNPITYMELINYDGHILVHSSETDFIQIASGDIGQNVLTNRNVELNIRKDGSFDQLGTATFYERKSGASLISIRMNEESGDHPGHIHQNSDLEGGSIVIMLNNVLNGKSDTHIEKDDSGSTVTFEDLLDYDGHIKIHESNLDFSVIAHADIGQNALTGNSEKYTIESVGGSGISGIAVLEERVSGATLVTMDLDGTTPGGQHPNHIHLNSLMEGGSVAISFNNINGNTGRTKTNIVQMDNGTSITYDELINFDGHFKVHNSLSDFSTVAEGEAGSNVLTGQSKVYQILEVNGSGVSGTATFEERKSGFTLITLILTGTYNNHPAHIHQNNTATGGSIVIGFTNVNGSTGLSINNIEQLDNGNPVTYQELINFNGHIRIHDSDSNFSAIAEGNIGSNSN